MKLEILIDGVVLKRDTMPKFDYPVHPNYYLRNKHVISFSSGDILNFAIHNGRLEDGWHWEKIPQSLNDGGEIKYCVISDGYHIARTRIAEYEKKDGGVIGNWIDFSWDEFKFYKAYETWLIVPDSFASEN